MAAHRLRRTSATTPQPTQDALDSGDSSSRGQSSFRSAWIRLALLLLFVATAFVALRYSPAREYIERERILALTESLGALPGATFVLTGALALLAALGVPVTLLMLVPGAVLGGTRGFLVSWAGLTVSAAALFFTGRSLAAPVVQRLLGQRRARFERAVRHRGFWPLVLLRFVPIPFSVCNLATGSAGAPAHLAIISAALGYAPVAAVWTFLGTALVSDDPTERAQAVQWALIAIAIVAAFTAAPVITAQLARRRRLADLRRDRIQRGR